MKLVVVLAVLASSIGYDFKAVTSRSADGRVTNATGSTVGHLHACFGATPDSLTESFYADGDLNGVRLTGRGECRMNERGSPEPESNRGDVISTSRDCRPASREAS